MVAFAAHLLVSAVLLLLVANLVPGIHIEGLSTALLAALALGLVNAFVRPVMVLLTLPLTAVTFGLFLFVVNALMLWLAAGVVPGFDVSGFGPALLGSLALAVLNVLVGSLAGSMRQRRR